MQDKRNDDAFAPFATNERVHIDQASKPIADSDRGQAMRMLSAWVRHGAHRRLQQAASSPPAASKYEIARWILSESYAPSAGEKRQRWNVVIADTDLCVESAKQAITKMQVYLARERASLNARRGVTK